MIHVQRYRKKPIVIEAVRLVGHGPAWQIQDLPDTLAEIASWCGGTAASDHIMIPTLEGPLRASMGDWIIKGVQGEFYPCKPDIFNTTYERDEER